MVCILPVLLLGCSAASTTPSQDKAAVTDDSGAPAASDTGSVSTSDTGTVSDGGTAQGDGGQAGDGGLPGDDGDDGDDGGDGGDTGQPEPPTAAECFEAQGLNADYDQFGPTIGGHCKGTNHQDIVDIEHVVFVGDSITVGTPPTSASDWYRNRLVDALMDRFDLEAPSWSWENVDQLNGTTYVQSSGSFSSCAKWGARTDDLTLEPHQQLLECIPEDRRGESTLVIMTIGGNDIFAWAQNLVEGATEDELWAMADEAVYDLEESVHWLTDDPSEFPAGIFLVFADPFEFTDEDSASDLSTCPGADLIGMDTALIDPSFDAIAAWTMEQYMRIATETGTDMVFMGEQAPVIVFDNVGALWLAGGGPTLPPHRARHARSGTPDRPLPAA